MPSWFDIATLPPGPDEFDEDGILESVATIENLVQVLVHSGTDSRRIVLVGFSQGAALSLMVSLKTRHTLGGVVSLSGWIPRRAREVSRLMSKQFLAHNSELDDTSRFWRVAYPLVPWNSRQVSSHLVR